MSNRDRAIQIIDSIPESKMVFVLDVLTGIEGLLISEQEEPNKETVEAMQELQSGGGEVFRGSTRDFISAMLED